MLVAGSQRFSCLNYTLLSAATIPEACKLIAFGLALGLWAKCEFQLGASLTGLEIPNP